MTRRFLRSWLLALPIVPLFAAQANASSITCYGSIVISTLGTEGMAISVPDGAIVKPTDPGAGPGFTLDAGTGATIYPNMTKPAINDAAPSKPMSGSNGGGSSGSGGIATPTSVTAAKPSDELTIIDDQVPVAAPPPEIGDLPAWPVETDQPGKENDPNPDPATPVDPAWPPIQTMNPDGPTDVNNTPEPATLTLLGLAGIGGWLKSRRRK